jgi:tripartite-type tricarboxylate transporter receptor subunit TctC
MSCREPFRDQRKSGYCLREISSPRIHWGHAVKLPRRKFLLLASGAAALPFSPQVARAQAYPTRPVRIIVGFAPGGPGDLLARLIGQRLSERLGQPFIVENRPGAASNIGTEAVVKSLPDGYTLLLTSSANFINATFYRKLNFNFVRDIAPVAGIVRVPNIMEISPTVPAKSVSEFIAYAMANPGKLSMASGGNGTASHVSGELFKMMTGVNIVHVPYRGTAPALADLLGGQVQVLFDQIISSIEYVRSEKVRALAVTTATRSLALPDVPTVADFVPGFEASTFFGIGAPRSTPTEIMEKLNGQVNELDGLRWAVRYFESHTALQCRPGSRGHHSGLMPANLITLAHFSVSSAVSLSSSAGEPASTMPPTSASRALMSGSARPIKFVALTAQNLANGGLELRAEVPTARGARHVNLRVLRPIIYSSWSLRRSRSLTRLWAKRSENRASSVVTK